VEEVDSRPLPAEAEIYRRRKALKTIMVTWLDVAVLFVPYDDDDDDDDDERKVTMRNVRLHGGRKFPAF